MCWYSRPSIPAPTIKVADLPYVSSYCFAIITAKVRENNRVRPSCVLAPMPQAHLYLAHTAN